MKIKTVLIGLCLAVGLVFGSSAMAAENANEPLMIQEQGSFMAGGTVIPAKEAYNPLTPTPESQTLHGDHAYIFYQIPINAKKYPMAFLHGAGQFSRTWETTPDGREGSFPEHGKLPRTDAKVSKISFCAKATACI